LCDLIGDATLKRCKIFLL